MEIVISFVVPIEVREKVVEMVVAVDAGLPTLIERFGIV